MNNKTSVAEIKDILKSLNAAYKVESQTDSSDLFAGGVLDSLSLIQYVMAIEKKFKIRLANEDITYESFRNFETIVLTLNKKYLS